MNNSDPEIQAPLRHSIGIIFVDKISARLQIYSSLGVVGELFLGHRLWLGVTLQNKLFQMHVNNVINISSYDILQHSDETCDRNCNQAESKTI